MIPRDRKRQGCGCHQALVSRVKAHPIGGITILELEETTAYGEVSFHIQDPGPGDVRFSLAVEAGTPDTLGLFLGSLETDAQLRWSLTTVDQTGRSRFQAYLLGHYASFADPDTLKPRVPSGVDWTWVVEEELNATASREFEPRIRATSCGTFRVLTPRQVVQRSSQVPGILIRFQTLARTSNFSPDRGWAFLVGRQRTSGEDFGLLLKTDMRSGFTWVSVLGADAQFGRDIAEVVGSELAVGRSSVDDVMDLGEAGYRGIDSEPALMEASFQDISLTDVMRGVEEASGRIRILVPEGVGVRSVSSIGPRAPWPTVFRDLLESMDLAARFVSLVDSVATVRLVPADSVAGMFPRP
jgi:hypothetical protein